MITAARFRDLALSLAGTTEVPHMDRTAFRTKRRIYATVPPGAETANLMLSLDLQEAVCEALTEAFSPVPGGWGRMGYTTVDLRVVSEEDLVRVLAEAHSMALAPKKKTAAKKKTPGKKTATT
ncbi:MAG: MmcQ/YjbR family DNA-binding protein [Polyangiaceae bacterium]